MKINNDDLSPKDIWERQWKNFSKKLFFKPNEKVTKEIFDLFEGNLKTKKILELGSGSGSDCITLAKARAKCYALDFSKEAQAVCQQLAREANIEIKSVIADCCQIPAKDDSFDLVFSVGLIEHFKNSLPLIKEQLRVLKPGGFLLIDVPQKYNLYTLVKHARMRFGKNPFGWETEYTIRGLNKIGNWFGIKVVRFYGRGSAFIGRLPRVIDFCWRKIFVKVEESKIAPFICLNIGMVCQNNEEM